MKFAGFAGFALRFFAALTITATAGGQVLAADFYAGRKLTMVVDAAPGGGYDTYGRLLARFYGNHIPGNPQIVVQNMPGAGGLTAVNWLWEKAPRDGTHIEIMSRSIPLAPLMGSPAARFDPLKLSWIGSINRELIIVFSWQSSGVKSFKDLLQRPASIGVTGSTADSALWARLFNTLLGAKLNIIAGYPGSDAVNLALERGENDLATGSWSSIKSRKSEWLRDKKINILVQLATEKNPELANVPLVMEFASSEQTRNVLEFFLAPQEMGRPVAAPPGVPADRLSILRKAFQDTMKDPAFLKAAQGIGADVDPITGDRMLEILRKVHAMPAKTIEIARAAAQQGGNKNSKK